MLYATSLFCSLVVLAAPLGALALDERQVGLSTHEQHSIQSSFPSSIKQLRRQPSIILSESLVQMSESKSVHKKTTSVRATKKSSHTQHRLSRSRRHKKLKRKKAHAACGGNKLRWWIKIKRQCVKSFGAQSRWDRDLNDGQCAEAWADCNTGFYATCCSQPQGASNMDAYCDRLAAGNVSRNASLGNSTSAGEEDKACQVQGRMRGVQDVIRGIRATITLMGVDPADTSSLEPMGPGPMPSPGPAPAPEALSRSPLAANEAPPGLVAPGMDAPDPVPAPAPAPEAVLVVPAVAPMTNRCEMLTQLTQQAVERIRSVKSWAKQDGIRDGIDKSENVQEEIKKSEDTEAKDPDLAFSVKGVMNVGDQLDALLKNTNFCYKAAAKDVSKVDKADDDEDDETAEKDDEEEEEDSDDDEVEPLAVNETAILDLLRWEGNMNIAVDNFENNVHPHGLKWWRYRYEYTIVESVVLAFSVVLLYFVMWLLQAVSFSRTYKFYKTGLPHELVRYAWSYLVFHAASLMVMVFIAYMLYMPWGEQNIVDTFATAVHEYVDGKANVPFLGYSWMYMALDVQYQLFTTFALYSLFIVMVVSNYRNALKDFKILSDDPQNESRCSPWNVELYKQLDATMKSRVADSSAIRQIFTDLNLRMAGVEGIDARSAGLNDFKMYIYLTDGLGKSLEYLVEVSLTTTVALFISALVVGLLAQHYQVAFMYFLPGFVALGFVLFIAMYFVSQHYMMLSGNLDHDTPTQYVTVHSFCRTVQIVLYVLLYSFMRLLLSNDIFEGYPMIYLSALIGLVTVLGLLAIFSGQVMKMITCALILPPHVHEKQLTKNLQEVLYWHTSEKCHECGVTQFPSSLSWSREWAGKAQESGERRVLYDAQVPGADTARPYSWRA